MQYVAGEFHPIFVTPLIERLHEVVEEELLSYIAVLPFHLVVGLAILMEEKTGKFIYDISAVGFLVFSRESICPGSHQRTVGVIVAESCEERSAMRLIEEYTLDGGADTVAAFLLIFLMGKRDEGVCSLTVHGIHIGVPVDKVGVSSFLAEECEDAFLRLHG